MRTLLNVDEASKFLNIHPTSLRRLVSKKKIPFIKREGIGVKFNPERLETWVREAEIEPSSGGTLTKKETGPVACKPTGPKQVAENQENLFTTAEIAKRLRCGIPTVRRYIKKGKFKRVAFVGKQFLVYESSIEEFIRSSDKE